MNANILRVLGAAGLLMLAATAKLLSQSQPTPRLNYVFPMGAQAGTTVELTVTGQDLEAVETLYFDFPGVKVEQVGGPDKAKISNPVGKKAVVTMKAAGQQLAQKFKVTLPPNAPLGIHDVRVVTQGGVSNPRAFVVGDHKEIEEKEPNDNVDKAQKVDLNTTINGFVSAGTDVDYFQFSAKKGQRVVVSCLSSSIDSKLPAVLELFSAGGKYLGSNKNYQGYDALLDVVVPEDGDYLVRLFSFTYTLGGSDYFYRLSISTTPWIDAVFPSAIEAGKEAEVTVLGRNLPGGIVDPASVEERAVLEKVKVKVKAPADPLAGHRLAFAGFVPPTMGLADGFEYRLKAKDGSSNGFLVTVSPVPVVATQGENLNAQKAQAVTLPCEIAGKIEKRDGRYWYRFQAKKGQVWNIEAFGDRRGSPLDLVYTILNAKGDQITKQDDNPDITANIFYTRTEDPARYRWTVAEDGEYVLMVTSTYAAVTSGPRHLYTIRISPEVPDFRLVAMPMSTTGPESVNLGQGGSQQFQVYAFRTGGFTGDITLTGQKLPGGVTMKPQLIAGTQKLTNFVLSAAADAPPYVGPIQIVGTALINGQKVVREARSATITWPLPQNVLNVPTITRLDRELVLSVHDRAQYALLVEKDKIAVPLGDRVTIPVKVAYLDKDFKLPVNVLVLNPPPGMILQQPLTLQPGKESGTLQLEGKANILPGNFTVVLRGQTTPILAKNQQPKGPLGPNFVQSAQPVTVTLVPKTLAKLAIVPPVKIQAGKTMDVTIRLARLNEYAGAFKVEVVNDKGLTAAPATIRETEDETKLHLDATKAAAGSNAVLTVRVTALFNDVPIVHETKLTALVIK